jgi:hypothetical protein
VGTAGPPQGGEESERHEHVARKIREKIRDGKLPNRRPARTWGGNGAGAPCAICDEAVTAAELELELDFTSDSSAQGIEPAVGDESARANFYRVHVSCWRVWQRKRTSLMTTPEATRAEAEAPDGMDPQDNRSAIAGLHLVSER